jgi:thiosulfate/3-mercaptopyruvate sulfurtransferase
MTNRVPPLVSTTWLADHLDDPGIIVLDGSWHLPIAKRDAGAEFLAAHIPDARRFDIDAISDRNSSLPHMLPTPVEFAQAVGSLGIGNDTHVVVYDAYGLMTAGRVWWTFRVFGHDRVSILDGGFPKWRAENHATASGAIHAERRSFVARFRPELVRDVAAMRMTTEQVVDARSAGRFEGTAPEPRPGLRGGHIPGSRNLPFDRLSDPLTKTVLPPERIAALFRDAGIDPKRPIVTTCGSGVTAAALAFGLFLLGNPDVAVYDGSWSEWGLPGDTPVMTGPAT